MRTTTNQVHVEGFLFSYDLQNRTSRRTGQEFIMGDINVATDDTGTSVVPIHFSYVTPTFKNGNPNATYQLLQSMIDGNVDTFEQSGAHAAKIRVDGDIEVNDFVTRNGDMASPMRVRGSFVHLMNAASQFAERPATFTEDMLITTVREMEYDNEEPYVKLDGYVFNFRGDILPVSFNVRSKGGMNYFLDADISTRSPMFTKIEGEIVNRTVTHETVEESAFGDPVVRTTSSSRRSFDVYFAAAEPYELDETGITKAELKQKLDEREQHLAEVKKSHDEYVATSNGDKSFEAKPKAAEQTHSTSDDDDEEWPF